MLMNSQPPPSDPKNEIKIHHEWQRERKERTYAFLLSPSVFHILRSGLYIYAAVCSQSPPFREINICVSLYVHMNMIHGIMNHNAV